MALHYISSCMLRAVSANWWQSPTANLETLSSAGSGVWVSVGQACSDMWVDSMSLVGWSSLSCFPVLKLSLSPLLLSYPPITSVQRMHKRKVQLFRELVPALWTMVVMPFSLWLGGTESFLASLVECQCQLTRLLGTCWVFAPWKGLQLQAAGSQILQTNDVTRTTKPSTATVNGRSLAVGSNSFRISKTGSTP